MPRGAARICCRATGSGHIWWMAPFPSDSLLKWVVPQPSSLQGKKMALPLPASLGRVKIIIVFF